MGIHMRIAWGSNLIDHDLALMSSALQAHKDSLIILSLLVERLNMISVSCFDKKLLGIAISQNEFEGPLGLLC